MGCFSSKVAPEDAALERRVKQLRQQLRDAERALKYGSLPLRTLQPCSKSFGHALGKLLPALGDAKMLIVSTPEHGPSAATAPDGPFDVPVMAGLERLANFLLQQVVPIYDFAGSASKLD